MKNKNIKSIDTLKSGDELIDLIKSGVNMPLIVTGSSMLPFLKEGCDTVWITNEKVYRRGQILFFKRSNGMFILHRIRRIYPNGNILVNGDSQTWCEVVHASQAIGIVCATERNGKIRKSDDFIIRLRDFLWYPTRPIRPFIFRCYRILRNFFRQ